MLPQGNLNFLNVRNAGLWHSGRLFAIKKYYYKCCHCKIWRNCLVTPPPPLILSQYFSSDPPFPFNAMFFTVPLKSHQPPPPPPHLITNERFRSMEFMCSFLRCHFMRKPVVVSKNVGCFLSLFILLVHV